MNIGQQSIPTAYLDANLIIGIRKRDLASEQAPLSRLLKAHKQGTLSLVTSPETRREIEKRTPVHDGDEDIYALLADVPVAEGESLVPRPVTNLGGSRLIGPVVVISNDDLAFLRATLPDALDANHVFQAISNGVDYFVTADSRTILRHAPAIESKYGIRLRLPSALVAEVGL